MKPAMAEAFTSEEKPTGGREAGGRRPSLMDPEPPMAATTETTTNGTTESKATEKLRSATAFEAIVVFAVLAAHVAGFVAAYVWFRFCALPSNNTITHLTYKLNVLNAGTQP